MMLSSLRLILLQRAERLLRLIVARLEPAAPIPTAPPASRPSADPHRPPPPAHWVELVQQYAPQLLDPANPVDPVDSLVEPEGATSLDSATGSDRKGTPDDFRPLPGGNIVNYREGAPKPALNPVPLQRSAPRPIDVARQRSPSNRPLRLEQVSARSLAAEPVSSGSSAEGPDTPIVEAILPSNGEQIEQSVRSIDADQVAVHTGQGSPPPLVRTVIRPVASGDSAALSALPPVTSRQKRRISRLFSGLHLARHNPAPTPALPLEVTRRSADLPVQPVHEIPTQANTREALPPRFAPNLPLERQRIREIDTSIPNSATVPTIRTGMGQAPQLHQGRTSLPTRPSAPPQTVLRPTLPSLNLDDVSPDRWPTLPDEPAETPRDPSLERQRRERLSREQEGSAWNE
ncbi:MAG: hypothetical protein ABI700_03480 [Chloroflexota bacterium]